MPARKNYEYVVRQELWRGARGRHKLGGGGGLHRAEGCGKCVRQQWSEFHKYAASETRQGRHPSTAVVAAHDREHDISALTLT